MATPMVELPMVELRQVGKRYGPLLANDDISLTVMPGQIHVLVGENGAGKSTLMGILSGTVTPDSGSVHVRGVDVTGHDARAAIARGIGMVHQHFRLVGAFSVAENIALGAEPRTRLGLLDRGQAKESAQAVSARFGLALDPDAVVDDMSVGMQQRVEIVKTLTRDAEVLIFDEPTAVLTEEEAAGLVEILHRLRDDGRAILFITHKLREALAVGDVVSVLRRGRLVATLDPAETGIDELGELMVGRPVQGARRRADVPAPPDRDVAAQEPVLSVRGAGVASRSLHGVTLRDFSLDVHPGEIVTILGVDGNGQQEVGSLLTGVTAPDLGTIHLGGTDVTGASTAALLAAGMGVVPADRHHEGLVLTMSLARNLVLDRRHEPRFLRWGGLFLDDKAIDEHAQAMIEKFDIRTGGPHQLVQSLSGGNQQKVVIARELDRDIAVLVAAHPTRGLDVGSIEFVHNQLIALASAGKAVVVVTSDLDEALTISDSIAVLHKGSIVGTVRPPFARSAIGVLMGGVAA